MSRAPRLVCCETDYTSGMGAYRFDRASTGADVGLADVVAEDDEDVWLLLRERRRTRHDYSSDY